MAESRATTPRQKDEPRSRGEREGSGEIQRSRQRTPQGLARPDIFASPFAASPFSLLRWMTDEIDRTFGRWPTLEETTWWPKVETFQRGDTFVVRAEMPGLTRDDVQVEINDDAVTLQGERRDEHKDEREGFYQSEWSYGSFFRRIPLPDGAIPDSARATFNNGVLEIELKAPPREVSRGRRVEVTEGSERKE